MRRFLLATGLGSLLLAGASAQIEIRQDDGGTDFTSRGSIGGATDGFAIQRTDVWGIQAIDSWITVMQDQNCSTLETWAFVLFGEDATTLGTADDTNVIASTGTFLSATNGSTGACAWIYTVTLATPLEPGQNCTGDGVFVGTFLPSNALWVADGTSTHISIHNAGGSAEYPNGTIAGQYPPATVGVGPGAVFGSEFSLANGGGAGTTYSGSWRIYLRNSFRMGGTVPSTGLPAVQFDVRCAAEESPQSVGLYASIPAISPTNYGMAGKYPDFTNQTGSAPAREDNLHYQSNNSDILAGIEQLFLAESTLRCGLGIPPISFPGEGNVELDITSGLFGASPGIHPTQAVVSNLVDHVLDLDATGIRPAFAAIPTGGGNLTVNYQAVRIDLGTGALRISNMRSWYYEF